MLKSIYYYLAYYVLINIQRNAVENDQNKAMDIMIYSAVSRLIF